VPKKKLQCVLKILNSLNWKNTISYNGRLRLGKANDNTIDGQQKYRIGVWAARKTTNQTSETNLNPSQPSVIGKNTENAEGSSNK